MVLYSVLSSFLSLSWYFPQSCEVCVLLHHFTADKDDNLEVKELIQNTQNRKLQIWDLNHSQISWHILISIRC